MTEILGMHWTLAVTILCLIMIAVDLIFVQGDILTFIADIIFVFVMLHFVPTDNLIWMILAGIVIYSLILTFHWFVYRKLIQAFIDKIIAPQKCKDNNEILVGQIGKICVIEEKIYIRIGDEYLPCNIDGFKTDQPAVDQKAIITEWDEDNKLHVRLI